MRLFDSPTSAVMGTSAWVWDNIKRLTRVTRALDKNSTHTFQHAQNLRPLLKKHSSLPTLHAWIILKNWKYFFWEGTIAKFRSKIHFGLLTDFFEQFVDGHHGEVIINRSEFSALLFIPTTLERPQARLVASRSEQGSFNNLCMSLLGLMNLFREATLVLLAKIIRDINGAGSTSLASPVTFVFPPFSISFTFTNEEAKR